MLDTKTNFERIITAIKNDAQKDYERISLNKSLIGDNAIQNTILSMINESRFSLLIELTTATKDEQIKRILVNRAIYELSRSTKQPRENQEVMDAIQDVIKICDIILTQI